MSSVTTQPTSTLEKDPLEMNGDIVVKQEIDELDYFEASNKSVNNEVVIKEETYDTDLNNVLLHLTSSDTHKVMSINNLSNNKEKVVENLQYNRVAHSSITNSESNNETVVVKKETPCNCMQNVEYYCNKCCKTFQTINEAKQCTECNSQLKLKCKLCLKRYKLLKNICALNLLANIKKEIDIKDEEHFVCFKCSFKTTEKNLLHDHIIKNNHQPNICTSTNSFDAVSQDKNETVLFCDKCYYFTKVKEELDKHILKSHWQPKIDANINSDDDMYIELLCKQCLKVCRKVLYDNMVKLVCRECQVPMWYRCTLCRSRYKLLKNVRHHVKNVCPYRMNNEKFYCGHCMFKTETKTKLKHHVVTKHLNQKCSNCHKVFEDQNVLKKHVLKCCAIKKMEVDSIKLELPSKGFTEGEETYVIIQHNPFILTKSVKSQPSNSTKEWGKLVDYFCLQCGGEAKKKFARYKPWCKKCNIKYDYRCISCEKLYGVYDRIHHHVKEGCPNRMVFLCPLCKYNTLKKKFLFNHIQGTHTIYKCMECFINIEGYSSLREHQTNNCSKDCPHNTEQLEKLISLYCKQCYKRPKKAVDTAIAECDKCMIILSWQCLKCYNVFDDRDFAYKHIKELCKPNFHCKKCVFKTYTQEGLNIHIKYKHLDRMCLDCGVCFKDELIFQLHRKEEIRRKREKQNIADTIVAYPKRRKAF